MTTPSPLRLVSDVWAPIVVVLFLGLIVMLGAGSGGTGCRGRDVYLPTSASQRAAIVPFKPLVIAIERDRATFISDKWHPDENLAGALRLEALKAPDRVAMIQADRRLPWSVVAATARAVSQAGFRRIYLQMGGVDHVRAWLSR